MSKGHLHCSTSEYIYDSILIGNVGYAGCRRVGVACKGRSFVLLPVANPTSAETRFSSPCLRCWGSRFTGVRTFLFVFLSKRAGRVTLTNFTGLESAFAVLPLLDCARLVVSITISASGSAGNKTGNKRGLDTTCFRIMCMGCNNGLLPTNLAGCFVLFFAVKDDY